MGNAQPVKDFIFLGAVQLAFTQVFRIAPGLFQQPDSFGESLVVNGFSCH